MPEKILSTTEMKMSISMRLLLRLLRYFIRVLGSTNLLCVVSLYVIRKLCNNTDWTDFKINSRRLSVFFIYFFYFVFSSEKCMQNVIYFLLSVCLLELLLLYY